MMIVFTLFVAFHFRKKSTGLKWDPVSIADYVALFAEGNALPAFASLELQHDASPKKAMDSGLSFRLGYWDKTESGQEEPTRVYGVGILGTLCRLIRISC